MNKNLVLAKKLVMLAKQMVTAGEEELLSGSAYGAPWTLHVDRPAVFAGAKEFVLKVDGTGSSVNWEEMGVAEIFAEDPNLLREMGENAYAVGGTSRDGDFGILDHTKGVRVEIKLSDDPDAMEFMKQQMEPGRSPSFSFVHHRENGDVKFIARFNRKKSSVFYRMATLILYYDFSVKDHS